MRWRLLHTALMVAAVLVPGVSRAEPDNFFADLDKPEAVASAAPRAVASPDGDAKLDPTPTASVRPAVEQAVADPVAKHPDVPAVVKPAVEAGSTAPASPKATDKGIDPEPDVAIKPVVIPSHDPLDALTPPNPPVKGAEAPATPDAIKPAAVATAGLDAAIKAALDARAAADFRGAERKKEREAVALLYAAHGYGPVWSDDGAPVAAVASVLERLAQAADDALTIAAPKRLKTSGSAAELAESDIALTEAVVAYARQASGSRVDPRTISPLIGAKPELAAPAEIVDVIAGSGLSAGDKLQALNPVDARYVALRDKRAAMRHAHAGTDTLIPAGPTLRVGMHDPRVPLLRSRFSLDVSLAADRDELAYDKDIAAAVADFQRANGVLPSGMLTKRTVEALAGGHSARLESTLAANMEMWRWMPHDLGADRIEVNVPEFTVTVFHDGMVADRHRVVVGKTDTPTPLFSNTMKFLIVNPVWNVPDSIIKKEFLPKSGDDPRYIAAHGFDVSYDHGRLVVKQPSGAKNALGQIKFMFPNDYSVYLHDTPSKSLFAASKRAFSHGCVRVDQPFGFAESVLNDGLPEGGKASWSQKRLKSMIGDKERYVYLPKPLPIHIAYFTAVVDPADGQVKLHDDIYGYANLVAAALGLENDSARLAEHKAKLMAEKVMKKSTTVAVDTVDPR